MTLVEQIAEFEKLAAVDQELRTVVTDIEKEVQALAALEKGLDGVLGELRVARDLTFQAEKTRAEVTTDHRSMSNQLDQSMQKFGRSRNERETNAAQREAEELRRLIRDRAEEVTKAEASLEALKIRVAEKEEEEKRIRAELSEEGTRAKIRTLEAERDRLTVARGEFIKNLPPVLFRKYEAVRAKRGSGFARSILGICKACNMSIPPQMQARLRWENLIEQCQSCQRLIYNYVERGIEAADAGADKATEGSSA